MLGQLPLLAVVPTLSRDGSYAVNALHCDVWVVCAYIVVCTVVCFIGFWGSVFWWRCIPTYVICFAFSVT